MRLSPRQPVSQSGRTRTVRVGLCSTYRLHVVGESADLQNENIEKFDQPVTILLFVFLKRILPEIFFIQIQRMLPCRAKCQYARHFNLLLFNKKIIIIMCSHLLVVLLSKFKFNEISSEAGQMAPIPGYSFQKYISIHYDIIVNWELLQ